MATEKRLIDARYLTSQMYLICEVCQTENIFIDAIIDEIDNAPDVDAVEVVHGRWEDVFQGNCAWARYKCSVCGGYALYRHEQVFDEWKTVQVFANYCPCCGAYMGNGEENGEM